MSDRTDQREGELDMDLLAIWSVLRAHARAIALCTVLSTSGAVVISIVATPMFEAQTLVFEVQEGFGGGAALPAQLSGLASIAGVNLAGSGTNDALAVLKSRRLVEEFIKRHDLLPVIYPDAESRPTLWRAVNDFQAGVLAIEEDRRERSVVIKVRWKDPELAADWANSIVALANEMIRTRALETSSRNIEFLNKAIAETNIVEMRDAFYRLVENETKNMMLASGRVEFAFRVVDPAVAPEQRFSPKRKAMVVVGFVLGLFLGVLYAFLDDLYVRLRSRSSA